VTESIHRTSQAADATIGANEKTGSVSYFSVKK